MEEGVTNTSIRDALGDMLGKPSTIWHPDRLGLRHMAGGR